MVSVWKNDRARGRTSVLRQIYNVQCLRVNEVSKFKVGLHLSCNFIHILSYYIGPRRTLNRLRVEVGKTKKNRVRWKIGETTECECRDLYTRRSTPTAMQNDLNEMRKKRLLI